ncbi:MAG TPA: LuxR C-terminal-related transcriptional regulator [Terriglobales bacterium]|jgi:DNA-binding NarL/FixJ family response regulator|nr:LuxR C-terminal-related transcriptional regulator [Terriglobales bacterium]
MGLEQEQSERAIRVLVADNTHIHTQLLADALKRDPSLEIAGTASHSRDLIGTVGNQEVDVAVISSNLDEEPLRGIEVLRELRALRRELRAIILLDSSKREVVLEAFRAGARGLFSRFESLETLCKCVHQVHDGQIWASGQQIAFAIETLASTPSIRAVGANGLSLLSKRELDVVGCLADGLTNREIAERLNLSQHTIKNYLFRVFDKLGVSSRLELMTLTLTNSFGQLPNGTNGSEMGGTQQTTLTWCKKAAEEGLPSAQVALAEMYRRGNGVAADPVSAYMWYLVSEKINAELKDEISAAKRQMGTTLTTDQIHEAQTQAMDRLKKVKRPASVAVGIGAAIGAKS